MNEKLVETLAKYTEQYEENRHLRPLSDRAMSYLQQYGTELCCNIEDWKALGLLGPADVELVSEHRLCRLIRGIVMILGIGSQEDIEVITSQIGDRLKQYEPDFPYLLGNHKRDDLEEEFPSEVLDNANQ